MGISNEELLKQPHYQTYNIKFYEGGCDKTQLFVLKNAWRIKRDILKIN